MMPRKVLRRPLTTPLVALSLVASIAACGDSQKTAPRTRSGAPSNAPPPSASQRPSASVAPSSSAPPRASASASSVPSVAIPPSKGLIKWDDFTGPVEKPAVKEGERVWAVMPVSIGWETLKFALHDVQRVDEDAVIVRNLDNEFVVPSVFTKLAEAPAKLEKGNAVMASAHDGRVFARVIDVGAKVKIRFRFVSDIEETEVAPEEVVLLKDELSFGQPVLVQDELAAGEKVPKTHPSQFVSSDGTSTWVVTFAGKPLRVPAASVHVMTVTPLRKPGDRVYVTRQEEVLPGVVRETLDDGVRYRVQLDKGDDTTVTLDSVTAPIKGTIAR
jgi:hypothetical protein